MKKILLLFLGVLMVLSFSCKKDENKSSEKQIVEFSIGTFGANADGKIDEETKTISFEVPSGTDVTKLVPVIKISPYASVSPAVGVAQDFTNPVTYTVIAEDGSKQVYTVKVVVLKSKENCILSFSFAGLNPKVEGKVDEASKTVALLVPFGTNVKELVPTVSISKNATVSPASGVKQDFSKPVTFTVTAEDGSKKDYVVTVSLGKNSEKSITSFRFAGLNPVVEGTIDEANKKILLMVPSGTDLKELTPSIQVSKNASVSPAPDAKQDFSQPVTYTVTAEDGSKAEYVVSVSAGKSSERSITSFKFAGLSPVVEGTIDEVSKKILLTVPNGTNLKELTPSILVSKNAIVSPASDAVQDFSQPVTYTVTAEDGQKQVYTISVVVEQSFESKIVGFKFASPAVSGVIDEAKHEIKLIVPRGTNIKELAPSIDLSNGATVLPVSGEKQDFSNPVTYTVTSKDGKTQAYAVSVEVVKSTECLVKEFKFMGLNPSIVASIDEENGIISAKVPFGTDVTSLVPTINISEHATVSPISGTATDFSKQVTFTVTSESGNTRAYHVSVTVDKDPSKLEIFSMNQNTFMVGIGEIVIKGQALKGGNFVSYIYFGDKKFKGTVNADGTEIRCVIPTTLEVGTFKVKVQVGANNFSNELEVSILENTLPVPSISGVNSTKLINGDVLVINGSNFMKSGNVVYLKTISYPATTYKLDIISENENTITASTEKVAKPFKFDLVVVSNGKEAKHSEKIEFSLKPAVIKEVSPLKLKAGEKITITGENFSNETLSSITIDDGGHKITYVDSKHVTIIASKDLKPGKYPLEIKIFVGSNGGGITTKTVYSTEIEIVE